MEDNQSLFGLQVDPQIQNNLTEASRWAKFVAVVISVAIGLIVLFFIIFGASIWQAFSSALETESSGIGMIVLLILLFFMSIIGILMYFLIRGANHIRKGLQNSDQALFNDGLVYMKNYFVMYGILSIISLLFSLLAII